MSIREQYGVPKRPPVPWWIFVLIGVVGVLALAMWRLGPGGPVWVAVIAVLVIAAVLAGVFTILSSRRLREPPETGGSHRPGPGRTG